MLNLQYINKCNVGPCNTSTHVNVNGQLA